jgi:hypothetical protein
MSQLIICKTAKGVLMAADRRVEVQESGQTRVVSRRKLFPVGVSAACMSGGAAMGIEVSRTLAQTFAEGCDMPTLELEGFILATFQKEYDAFVRRGEKWFSEHPEAHRRSYFFLGALGEDSAPVMRFYASEEHGEPYRSVPIGEVLTAPRRIGLESRLAKAVASGAGLAELKEIAVEGMRRIEKAEESVGGPFDVVMIDSSGLQWSQVS